MIDIKELYNLTGMQVQPRHEDYPTYYLRDLITRIIESRKANGGVMTEAVQADYDWLGEDDRALVDEYLETYGGIE